MMRIAGRSPIDALTIICIVVSEAVIGVAAINGGDTSAAKQSGATPMSLRVNNLFLRKNIEFMIMISGYRTSQDSLNIRAV